MKLEQILKSIDESIEHYENVILSPVDVNRPSTAIKYLKSVRSALNGNKPEIPINELIKKSIVSLRSTRYNKRDETIPLNITKLLWKNRRLL